MFALDLFQSVKAALAKARSETSERLAAGRWQTEAKGRELVGEIAGLDKARQLLTDEMQKIEALEESEVDES